MFQDVKKGAKIRYSLIDAWWRHQMGTFSALLAICEGDLTVTGEFPSQRPVTRSFVFSLICFWINGWVNSCESGDLRRHRTHYDFIVMEITWLNIYLALI